MNRERLLVVIMMASVLADWVTAQLLSRRSGGGTREEVTPLPSAQCGRSSDDQDRTGGVSTQQLLATIEISRLDNSVRLRTFLASGE